MNPVTLKARFDDALSQVAWNIGHVASQFGPEDFPSEWEGFRNHLFGFTQSLFSAMDFHLREKPDDLWTMLNKSIMGQLRPEHIIKVAGSCHYFIAAMQPYEFEDRLSDPAKHLIITLNWITNIYGNDNNRTKEWFDLCRRPLDHRQRYVALRDMAHKEIAYATLSDPGDEERSSAWGGLALMADFGQSEYEKKHAEEWSCECRRVFG